MAPKAHLKLKRCLRMFERDKTRLNTLHNVPLSSNQIDRPRPLRCDDEVSQTIGNCITTRDTNKKLSWELINVH